MSNPLTQLMQEQLNQLSGQTPQNANPWQTVSTQQQPQFSGCSIPLEIGTESGTVRVYLHSQANTPQEIAKVIDWLMQNGAPVASFQPRQQYGGQQGGYQGGGGYNSGGYNRGYGGYNRGGFNRYGR